jgi:D-alanine-D-alanine ligase
MRIAILHNAVSGADAPDEQDVLVQVEAVGAALGRLGHQARPLPCTLDLAALRARLAEERPDLAFNLVESLDGTGRLIHLVPALLDHLRIGFTGAPTEAVLATSHKLMAKERMRALGLPTPAWLGPFPPGLPPVTAPAADGTDPAARWIVKSLWEHASIGIDEASLQLYADAEAAGTALVRRSRELGGACFAERFVDGREFNLSLLAGPAGPEVLRPAEILFEGYAADVPRVVGYRAKWDAASYEFHHTPRRFDFPPGDAPLIERLRALALLDGVSPGGVRARGFPGGRAGPAVDPGGQRQPVPVPGRRLRRRAQAHGHRVHPRDRAGPGRCAALGFGFTVASQPFNF